MTLSEVLEARRGTFCADVQTSGGPVLLLIDREQRVTRVKCQRSGGGPTWPVGRFEGINFVAWRGKTPICKLQNLSLGAIYQEARQPTNLWRRVE